MSETTKDTEMEPYPVTMDGTLLSAGMGLIKAGTLVADYATYPLHTHFQQPWIKTAKQSLPNSKEVPTSSGRCFRAVNPPMNSINQLLKENIDTPIKAIEKTCKQYPNKRALGTRRIIKEFEEKQPNGKMFKKLDMGGYVWTTYSELNKMAHDFGNGLRSLGQQPKENLIIFAETRQEWLISAIGCFKQNIPVCTMYATLGDDAVAHGINETEVTHVITSHELLPKFKGILAKCPKVTHITYFKNQLVQTDTTGYKEGVAINSFEDVLEMEKKVDFKDEVVSPSDTCIIMYTSGSTGNPKGVIITHGNLFSMMLACLSFVEELSLADDDSYLAFLPLAHIFELIMESAMMLLGVPMGYSNALTIHDRSSKIKRGSQGDASLIRPTVMAAVPLILDRIYKGALDVVARQGPWINSLVHFALEYKNNWQKRGYNTPLLDWVFFRKVNKLLGGRMKLMIVGGAPLKPEVHDFVRATLGCPIMQAYGLTETSAGATTMTMHDISTGRVGAPLYGVNIKIVDWEEGNYRITDKPNPRGEIVIGGDCVAAGYYKNPEKTKEEFFEEDGKRWFRTGDIGEVESDGALRIIDRKKDLVKLTFGEYVSLGKVEGELKVCPLVETMCIYGDSTQNFVVALVSPDANNLKELARSLELDDSNLEKLCMNPKIKDVVLKDLQNIGKKAKLQKFEIPGAVHLGPEQWLPDTGLVTALFKLKRKAIQIHYQDAINKMVYST
ncbi:unnamed protein product, partial [Meganyctiphanes norvegica]